ncbi:MAG: NAD(P)/FAD-dependent oxidoreductase [Hyphomonas sp.]|nr:NAD(P)/FAD-dependent oxidoreductase [Hyphomonas sp.]
MTQLDRRVLLKVMGSGAASLALPTHAYARSKARIVIIGGGFGGASAARMLATLLPSSDITLIDVNATYTACPFSNLVLGTDRALSQQQFGYDGVQQLGVNVLNTLALDVDPVAQTVALQDAEPVSYDRLILSPGIDMRWNALQGYDEAAAQRFPHAWKAGPQTLLLRRKLDALEDGQPVIMSVPTAPFRCPPGPYERASMIAHYLKSRKPRSKLIVLDAKDSFSKMDLFQEAWREHYPDHLEWRGASDDGTVSRVDAATQTIETDFESFSAPAINIIPPQKAGFIADRAGVSNGTGWCPIDPLAFESTQQPNIHVIGDATIAAPMPKSAFSANLQAKVCAMGVARLVSGLEPEATVLSNTCYSFTTPEEAISISGVYTNENRSLASISGAGGVSPMGAEKSIRYQEADQARSWFETITSEAFG